MMPGQVDWAEFGYPELDAAIATDTARRNAALNRRADAEQVIERQAAELATDPRVVLIGDGTAWAEDRRREAITAHVEHRRSGNALHMGPGGRPYEPPRAEVHMGVLAPATPRLVFEVGRDYPLRDVLHSMPVDTDPPPACELPASVPIVGGGSSLCTGKATGWAVHYSAPWILVWRCCVMCARRLFEDRWRRTQFAQEGARYVPKQQ